MTAGGATAASGSPSTISSSGGTGPFQDFGDKVASQAGAVATKLPSLPAMTNVQAVLNDDSASITFDPFDGAVDYRVYPLPTDDDITVTGNQVVVKNGIYRCAGQRESAPAQVDDGPAISGITVHTQVDNQTVGGYTRTLAEATLGYVYTAPAPGLVPVYALGDSDTNADTNCLFARWAASRAKKYTSAESERTQLLAGYSRDDGIAFYVPATADATTTQIYYSEDQAGTPYAARYYFADGPEAAMRTTKTPAFSVLTAAADGTLPLMRVFYSNVCGWSHDELAVGKERFNRVQHQGDKLPWWSLLWSGITGPTTLVVEALDAGCPFQGHLSPTPLPSITTLFGTMPLVHQPYLTIDDVQKASATGEVFINGQTGPAWIWDGTKLTNGMQPAAPAAPPLPKAIARAFVQVIPNPHPKMDFFADFSPGATPEVFTDTPCGSPDGNCFATTRQQSPTFDQMFMDADVDPVSMKPIQAYGPVMGELWETFADVSGDTNGKYRLTAVQKASLADSSFLHATMEVDGYSTLRRYPQILISDRDVPIQYTLDQGHTLVIQPRSEGGPDLDWPVDYQLQVCNMHAWDVNNQCPLYDLHHLAGDVMGKLAPNEEVGEHASVDHRITFDVYASTKRVYLFLDHTPYGCADLAAGSMPSGPVTVTWGDVLYHSAVDHTYAFHTAHLQIETRRHFDNLGFSSGVAAPGWDESRLPCAPSSTLH
jgi:hypothetical protein